MALPEVNACFWCDQPEQGHAWAWNAASSWHQWTAPPNALRKVRLKALRAAGRVADAVEDLLNQEAQWKRSADL